jgi:hypothetical protein
MAKKDDPSAFRHGTDREPVPALTGLSLEEGCLDANLKVRFTEIHKPQLKWTHYP